MCNEITNFEMIKKHNLIHQVFRTLIESVYIYAKIFIHLQCCNNAVLLT